MARRFRRGVGGRVATRAAVAVLVAIASMPPTLPAARATVASMVVADFNSDQELECRVRPRSFSEILVLIDSPALTSDATPLAEPERRATRETTVEIESLIEAFLDCSAAGEPLRVWSLYSDAYLRRLLERERGYDRARYDADLVAEPLGLGGRPELRVVSHVMTQGEDRASATVVIRYPNLDREKMLAWRFVRVMDVWLIDEIDGEITFAVP